MSIRPIKQFFLVFLVTTLALVAQSVTGNISGTVTDSTNSPLSGATVTVTNADQGTVAWTGKTNDSGIYRAPSLPVGRYNVAFEAPGFKKRQISQVNLSLINAPISAPPLNWVRSPKPSRSPDRPKDNWRPTLRP